MKCLGEDLMNNTAGKVIGAPATKEARTFNFNKLQAVACMMASAAVSIGLIVWAVKTYF